MKGIFRRMGLTAVAVGDKAKEALFAIEDGKTFVADCRSVRNPHQMRLFWKLMDVVANATDDDQVQVKKWVLYKLNFVDTWFEPDGTMHIEPQSIAYESMEQADFNRLMDKAIPLIATRLETTPAQVREEFERLLDPEERALWRGRKAA